MDQSTLIESLQTTPVLLFAFVAHERRRFSAALGQGEALTTISRAGAVSVPVFSPASFTPDLLMHPVLPFALGVR